MGQELPLRYFCRRRVWTHSWDVMLNAGLQWGPLNLVCKAIRYTWNYFMLFNYKICLEVSVSLSPWDVWRALQAWGHNSNTYTASSSQVTLPTVSGLITVHYIVQHFWARGSEIYRLPGDNHFKKKDQWYASHWKEQQVPISALLEDIKHLHKLFKGRNYH